METNVQSKVLAVENDYWWFKVRREILVELTTKFVVPGSRALDLGCGTGFIAQKLIKYYDLSLVDSNKEALDICKDKGLCGINASIHHLPFEDSTFDLVYCFDVLYHRSVQPCERALNEIYRVLNKGGYFIVSEPAFSFLSNLEERTDYAAKRFTKKEIEKLLNKFGFRVLLLGYFNTILSPLILMARIGQNIKYIFRSSNGKVTEFEKPLHSLINNFFTYLFRLEKTTVMNGGFPIGTSIFSVAKK